ncbi:collagen alpha-1(XVII) chain-like [Stylophora pistillata]|nr:collagen alpha-1(XVII) chain-like [Stylophora pistillata]
MNSSRQPVDRLISWMTTLHALANQTEDNLNDFKNDAESSLLSVNTGLKRLEENLNATEKKLVMAMSETKVKLENESKLQGPVGQRGFNGSQGPVGPAGPRGFNGTQGPQGVIGLQGFNGSQGPPGPQGPKGAGDFSQCKHKTKDLTGNQPPITSNSLPNPIKVILGEPSGKKILGVSCTTDYGQIYLLSHVINGANGQLFYHCSCYGQHGTGQASVKCVMHYWECPLTT